jgi:hypothetical protein
LGADKREAKTKMIEDGDEEIEEIMMPREREIVREET